MGTIQENNTNKIEILEVNPSKTNISPVAEIPHGYPATKLMWGPQINGHNTENLIATTSDCLKIFEVKDNTISKRCELINQ